MCEFFALCSHDVLTLQPSALEGNLSCITRPPPPPTQHHSLLRNLLTLKEGNSWLRNRPSYLNSEINVTIFTLWNRRALVSLRRMILIQFAGEVSSHLGSKVHGHTARFHITHFITAPLMWNLFSSDDMALYDFVVYWCLENNGATFVICLSMEYLVYIHSWIYVTCQGEGRPR